MRERETQVLIVGGGGAGLTASSLLSQLGVDTYLVSSLPTTSKLPKAHVLNQRAMEILTDVGIADEIYERGTPAENMSHTAFYAGLAGDDDVCGRQLGKMECWGTGGLDELWASASACRQANLPQIRLEPIMKARADELAPGRVQFNAELKTLSQHDAGVSAVVLDKDSGEEFSVRAQYVLACDAGRTVGPQVGAELEGARELMNIVSVYMSADLSQWARDPDVLIRWLWFPSTGTLATLVPMGPDHWGPDSEEWVFHMNYETADTRAVEDAAVVEDMKSAMGLPDLDAQVHIVSRWSMEGILANQFQFDRVFLVGDAAHRHPPTGGLGLTSAIHDAHNICWKLAAVLSGHAGEELLTTYEPERRPADAENVERALASAFNHLAIGESLGVGQYAGPEENLKALRRALSHDPADREHRRRFLATMATQSMEFREHNVEYGYTYDSSAVVSDGTPEPPSPDGMRVYTPGTRPGAPLPHAWLDDLDGRRYATMDLVRPGRFLLIAGEEGMEWIEAAASVADELGVPLDAVRIGHLEGDFRDPRCMWLQRRETSPQGAVLVRPDRFVAWRSMGAVAEPARELADALSAILSQGSAVVA